MANKVYEVRITKSANKDLGGISDRMLQRIIPAIRALSNNPRPSGCKKLKGYENRYRIRISDYRVLYRIEDVILVVEIVGVKDRKDAY